jgi:hypothetical protein
MSSKYQMIRFIFAALGILLGTVPVARVAVTSCTTTISDKRIDGDLVVPAGKTCDLEDVTVTGNVHVGKGAYFFAQYMKTGSTAILGNFITVDCAFVILLPSVFVGEDVQIEGCNGGSVSALTGSSISGNFECVADPGGCEVGQSTVGGNMQVNNNGYIVQIQDNHIGGNLQCVGNPASTLTVGGNTVAGNKQGQCASASAGTGQ